MTVTCGPIDLVSLLCTTGFCSLLIALLVVLAGSESRTARTHGDPSDESRRGTRVLEKLDVYFQTRLELKARQNGTSRTERLYPLRCYLTLLGTIVMSNKR